MKQLEQYAVCGTQLLTFCLLVYGLLQKNFHGVLWTHRNLKDLHRTYSCGPEKNGE